MFLSMSWHDIGGVCCHHRSWQLSSFLPAAVTICKWWVGWQLDSPLLNVHIIMESSRVLKCLLTIPGQARPAVAWECPELSLCPRLYSLQFTAAPSLPALSCLIPASNIWLSSQSFLWLSQPGHCVAQCGLLWGLDWCDGTRGPVSPVSSHYHEERESWLQCLRYSPTNHSSGPTPTRVSVGRVLCLTCLTCLAPAIITNKAREDWGWGQGRL